MDRFILNRIPVKSAWQSKRVIYTFILVFFVSLLFFTGCGNKHGGQNSDSSMDVTDPELLSNNEVTGSETKLVEIYNSQAESINEYTKDGWTIVSSQESQPHRPRMMSGRYEGYGETVFLAKTYTLQRPIHGNMYNDEFRKVIPMIIDDKQRDSAKNIISSWSQQKSDLFIPFAKKCYIKKWPKDWGAYHPTFLDN